MERKYLLMKQDYSYYDYLDFMDIQKSMLKYYAESGKMLIAFSNFFKMINFFYKIDTSFYNDYVIFDSKLLLSYIIRMHLGFSRFYFKFFIFENFFFKKFIIILLILFKVFSFSS